MNQRQTAARTGGAGALVLSLWLLAAAAHADELGQRLAELNIRHETKHYVLAGTVSTARLREYGRALEFIHREYERAFGKLLNDGGAKKGDKDASTPRERAAREKAAKRNARGDGKPQPTGDPQPADDDPTGDDDSGASPAATGDSVDDNAPPPAVRDALAGANGRFPVILFANQREYEDFGSAFLGSSEHTRGMYIPRHRLLLVLDDSNSDETFGVLFHEALHQFMHRYVPAAPVWINEGLAELYETARPTASGVRFEARRAKHWALVRKAIEKKAALPLSELLAADSAAFYDKAEFPLSGFEQVRRQHLYYGQAYTLVHLLADDAQGRKRLQEYLRDLIDSPRQAAALTEKHFGGKDGRNLEDAWQRYVKSRPESK